MVRRAARPATAAQQELASSIHPIPSHVAVFWFVAARRHDPPRQDAASFRRPPVLARAAHQPPVRATLAPADPSSGGGRGAVGGWHPCFCAARGRQPPHQGADARRPTQATAWRFESGGGTEGDGRAVRPRRLFLRPSAPVCFQRGCCEPGDLDGGRVDERAGAYYCGRRCRADGRVRVARRDGSRDGSHCLAGLAGAGGRGARRRTRPWATATRTRSTTRSSTRRRASSPRR